MKPDRHVIVAVALLTGAGWMMLRNEDQQEPARKELSVKRDSSTTEGSKVQKPESGRESERTLVQVIAAAKEVSQQARPAAGPFGQPVAQLPPRAAAQVRQNAQLVQPRPQASASASFSYGRERGPGRTVSRPEKEGNIPDLYMSWKDDLVEPVVRKYGLVLALVSMDSVVALVRDPFGAPGLANVPSDLSSRFSSRGRDGVLPSAVHRRILEAISEMSPMLLSNALVWLCPRESENAFIESQLSAISRAGLDPASVEKTIGYYDASDLRPVFDELILKTGQRRVVQ